jgi:pyruvate dehydrogenase E1 component alpha subunit
MATTMLGTPSLEPVQLLQHDGTRVEHHRYRSDPTRDELIALYEAMVVTRVLDQELINLQRQGQLALYGSCRGQEAAQVGLASALQERDWLFPSYRELGVWVWRAVDPVGLGAMWRGTWHGGADLVEHRSAPMSIPIGTQALHAVGYAMGIALDGEPSVAVACFGDGATSEGDVHEAMNFAAVYEAPCIFFVQNNQWAISVPFHEQTSCASIAQKAVAYGMPGVRCDGNDVLATRAVVKEAADRARRGGGPTLIEAVTYRMEAHTTSDDPTRYRTAEELELWAQLDPLSRFGRMLEREGLLTDEVRHATEARASALSASLRDGIVDAPDLDPDELFAHVFAEPTPALLEQREELRAELAHGGA